MLFKNTKMRFKKERTAAFFGCFLNLIIVIWGVIFNYVLFKILLFVVNHVLFLRSTKVFTSKRNKTFI